MAYLPNQNQDENELDEPKMLGPQGGVIGSVAGTQGNPSASTSAPNAGGGSFTDISKYLSQNKEQAAGLTQKVSQSVANQGQQAKSALKSQQDEFDQKVADNTVRANQDLVTEAVSNPNQVVQDQAKKAEFIKMRDANYQGPQNLTETENYSTNFGTINKGQNAIQALNTESGRQGLVSNIGNSARKNMGTSSLDNLLVQADPNSKNVISQTKNAYSDLDQRLQAAQEASLSRAQEAKAQTEQAKKISNEALMGTDGQGGAIQNLTNDIDKRYQDYTKDLSLVQNDISRDLSDLYSTSNDGLDSQTLAKLGLTPDERLFGLRLREFLPDPTLLADATRDKFATTEDYQKYLALSELAGQNPTFLSKDNVGIAGTAPQYNIDNAAIRDYLNKANDLNSKSAASIFDDKFFNEWVSLDPFGRGVSSANGLLDGNTSIGTRAALTNAGLPIALRNMTPDQLVKALDVMSPTYGGAGAGPQNRNRDITSIKNALDRYAQANGLNADAFLNSLTAKRK